MLFNQRTDLGTLHFVQIHETHAEAHSRMVRYHAGHFKKDFSLLLKMFSVRVSPTRTLAIEST